MPVSRADSRKRVVVSVARAGDVFDAQPDGKNRIVLVRLDQHRAKLSRSRCLSAVSSAPLKMKTSWEELKAMTREP